MTDAMVFDANVLEHLFDPCLNADRHIDSLLRKCAQQQKKLGIDRPAAGTKGRIIAEYEHRLQFHRHAIEEDQLRSQWLRYLLVLAERVDVTVDLADGLGTCIAATLNRVGAERSDHVYAYVACALNSVMVSDDDRHITRQRNNLRRCAHRAGSNDTDFVSSNVAESMM
ncbi:MAG: hypothetical protein PHR35_09150 [Kiritimatiellae bacterium]|nr:hypothetical protein [Kiritimatiellia bacterium]